MHADDGPSTATDTHPSHAPLRRLKSKSSLWSLASSTTTTSREDDLAPEEDKSLLRPSILRRLSPALAARVKLLDGGNKASASRNASTVGRIPEAHLKELDSLHQDLSIRVERKGQAWAGLTLTSTSPEQIQNASKTSQQRDFSRSDPGPGLDHTDVAVDGSALSDPTTAHTECSYLPPSSTSMSVAEPAPAQLRADPDTAEPQSSGTGQDKTDFEKYVEDTARKEEGAAPIPPSKDSPRTYSLSSSSQFNPRGLQRTESIYSFSRASFSNQLSQLTSIPLPQPSSLEANIASISTALAAVRALNGAAEQITIWVKKASDVLNGLDAEDDVEWAAAGGREGLESVDKAVTRFESLVNVYVAAIENVQLREDIATVDTENLQAIVGQMESILQNWSQIKVKLQGVKDQVELAMEWEELWSNVLGDVGMEIENLSGLIFEMEEKRHETLNDPADSNGGLDINELETIVEESPVKGRSPLNNRLSIGPMLAGASGTPVIKTPQDDSSHSNLMAIFARMQPLRASLDFLPMRLSMFQSRADSIFPSACEELEDRRSHLEKSYKVLEADAESLRKELGEDKWILVFRNAGSQAQKMFESVERSIGKLQEGIETGLQLHSPSTLTKRMENYEAKKQHYVPAIERVVGIIQKGVKDRLTVNGEILRLLSDMTSRTDALKASIRVMDTSLEDVQIVKGQQLRDSISSIITMDSPLMGSAIETPGSSPASSVILAGNGHKGVSTPHGSSSRRESSVGSSTGRLSLSSKIRRYSGLPQATSSTLSSRKSSIPQRSGAGSPTLSNARGSYTPTPASRKSSRPSAQSPLNNRPRWNNSTNTNDLNKDYNFKPLSATTPSAYRKSSAPAHSRPSSTIPLPNPFRRDISASPAPGHSRSISRVSTRQGSRSPAPMRDISPRAPAGNSSILDPPPYSRLRRPSGLSNTPSQPPKFRRDGLILQPQCLAKPRPKRNTQQI
ncbi:hypothetical protein N7474_001134 [Penicillium riverlandense]|uniref:uncharacterized protein n=1 Tax=Penicillium riverlandense TaxID=1903569 RepID=UPI0025482DDE|nr:uncharacterized protein N7474_001134 [Penicillium riverlandense]KAJ5832823.1 hypothetical protein N7474_001134 [Penicillium riverlandense]